MNRKSTPEGFYKRVDKNGPNGCWSWLGSTNKLGYGQLGYQGRRMTAHRLSYELNRGVIPSDRIVRHTCDNPNCCNPDHLLLGTHQDNANDKKERGRTRGPAGSPSINPVFKTVEERDIERYGQCQEGHTLGPRNAYTKKSGEVVCAVCYYTNRYFKAKVPLAPQEQRLQADAIKAASSSITSLLESLPVALREDAIIGMFEEARRIMNEVINRE